MTHSDWSNLVMQTACSVYRLALDFIYPPSTVLTILTDSCEILNCFIASVKISIDDSQSDPC